MNEYIGYLISALGTGGLTWLVTLKSTRKQAEAEAMAKVQDVYQELIEDLKRDREEMKATIKQLNDRVTELDKQCQENARKVEQMRPFLCTKAGCNQRINKAEF